MNDINEVYYNIHQRHEEMRKKREKRYRRDEALFLLKWFMVGVILGGIVMFITGCGSDDVNTKPTTAIEESVTEEPALDKRSKEVAEPDRKQPDKSAEPVETEPAETEPAETEHANVNATWRESTKTHDNLNVNSALTFDGGIIWNFSDCTAIGKSAESDVTTATEADYGFIIRVEDDDTVIVDPYDNSNTGIVPLAIAGEVASGDYISTETADVYEITGYETCSNGLGIIEVLFSDNVILTAGIYKENGELYAVNIDEKVTNATIVIDCRLAFEGLMDNAGITEADAVYTDPIYYPIVPVNAGETTDTAYWVDESSKIVEADWSDARKIMTFYNYVIDNFAYDKWIIAQGDHARCFYYNDFSGKYYISKTRVGVCEDFSQVFAIMCRAQGIPALEIHSDDHAMTAVYVDDYGRWLLIDTTADIMHDAYQEDYTIWKESDSKRYRHLNDVSDPKFEGISIGNYEDMENFGIPTYE